MKRAIRGNHGCVGANGDSQVHTVRQRMLEFGRTILRERTAEGLKSARKAGRIGGRRTALGPEQQAQVVKLVTDEEMTAAEAARLFNVHPATVSRLLRRLAAPNDEAT